MQKNTFTVTLAGRAIEISAGFASTRQFCAAYLTDCAAEEQISVTPADIASERQKSEQEDRDEGIPVRHFSDAYLETLAVYRKIAERMPEHDTVLFHGSAIAVDGVAYLFAAKSGTGKSTHTRLWRKLFGERAVMVNDDKPLLQIGGSGVTVYGTPWDGKHRLSSNIAVPLKAICMLERGETNRICPLTKKEAFPAVLQQVYRPADAAELAKTLLLTDRLCSGVSLYRLQCNMEPEAALVAYRGMNERTEI